MNPTTVHLDYRVEPDEGRWLRQEIKKNQGKDIGLNVEEATIHNAYFGKDPLLGPPTSRSPLGLNILLRYNSSDSAEATLTDMAEITGFMNDFGVGRLEQLAGRKVRAYLRENALKALSRLE